MVNDATKGALLSGTIWGALLGGVPQLINLVTEVTKNPPPLDPKIAAAASIIGMAIAIYKRIKATKSVTGLL